jgi:hypothetical protein
MKFLLPISLLFIFPFSVNSQISKKENTSLNSTKAIDVISIQSSLFNVELKDDEVQFSWSTRTENDNDYFTIEKSQDGISYESFEIIDAKGNSASIVNYSTIDASPFNGVSYYRLLQTDINGRSKSIETKSINYKKNRTICYPNPFNNSISIESLELRSNDIYIFNSFGINITSTVTICTQSDFKSNLDFNQLPSGLYYVKFGSDKLKVVKSN